MNSENNNNNYFRYSRQHCGFCKNNKEPLEVYSSHRLKDERNRVTCPQLYKYRCELCGATGEDAHTRSYCPNADNIRRELSETGKMSRTSSTSTDHGFTIQLGNDHKFSNMRTVTSTRYNSAGRVRKPAYGHQANNASASHQFDHFSNMYTYQGNNQTYYGANQTYYRN